MDIENLKKVVMQQAKAKGFGTKPNEVKVYEKIALIHSEISEAYSAYLNGNMDGKDGFYEEIGDTFQRTLHLGGIYNINFSKSKDNKGILPPTMDAKIAYLHKIVSEAFENYRHNNIEQFKNGLVKLAFSLIVLSDSYKFSLEKAVLKKVDYNKDRDWNKNKMNERFSG